MKAVDSFAVVKAPALTGATVAHELGHMQGLDHNRENASEPVPGKFHYGFRVCAGDGFRDIMSFGCPKGARVPIIQQYSNPRLTYNGYKTGVDPAEDPANAADAARGLDDMAVFIAMFREPPVAAAAVRAINDANGQGINYPYEPGSRPDRSIRAAGLPPAISSSESPASVNSRNAAASCAESTGLVSTVFIPATRQRSVLSRDVCAVRPMTGVVPPFC